MLDQGGRIRQRIRTGSPEGRTARMWRGYTAAGAGAISVLVAAIGLSTLVRPDTALHTVALFAHLGFLTLGFGAVLVADYSFALWVLGRATFPEAVAATTKLHVPIWIGLFGLMASGALLSPDLGSPTTVVKLALVAVLTANGVQAMALSRRMSRVTESPPVDLLLWGAATSVISQICWWGAVVIGFLHANR
jgi:hypothetical protein